MKRRLISFLCRRWNLPNPAIHLELERDVFYLRQANSGLLAERRDLHRFRRWALRQMLHARAFRTERLALEAFHAGKDGD
jgi:hypothetical protein